MRILFRDEVRNDATLISSDNETPAYPAQNLQSIFYVEQYIALFSDDVITIDLGADFDLNCVFIAELNAATFDIDIKNSSNVSQYSANDIENTRKILPIYFDTVSARYIVITADASDGLAPFVDTEKDMGTYLKIKKLASGVYKTMPVVQGEGALLSGYSLTKSTGTRSFESASGQVIATKLPLLRERDFTFKQLSYETLSDIFDSVERAGLHTTLFVDIFEDTENNDPPIFAQITDIRNPVRQGPNFSLTLSLKEAR